MIRYVFFIFFFPAAYLLITGAGYLYWGALSCYWPSADGVILFSDSVLRNVMGGEIKDNHATQAYFPIVRYQFKVEGKSFESRHVWFGQTKRGGLKWRTYIQKYQTGDRVSVFYDPHNPSRCVLSPGVSSEAVVRIFGGAVFAVAGIAGLLGASRRLAQGTVSGS